MIAFLRGTLFSKTENECLIDCGGVGYSVRCSGFTSQELPETGTVFLYVYHHIIENDQQLFGFASTEERMAFEQLITVKGIGPKLALSILTGISFADLINIIFRKDSLALSKVPGIGKKTADRIILELSDRISSLSTSSEPGVPAASTTPTTQSELAAGLMALGYKKLQAETAASKVVSENPGITNLSTLVKAALRALTG